MSKRTKAAPVAIAAVVLGAICGSAVAAATNGQSGDTYVPKPLHTNARGLTFGSAADVTAPGTEPDLTLVVATNGREGYAYSSDLDGTAPQSPAEAASLNARNIDRPVPVYESDGTTRIGTFVVGSRAATQARH